MFCSMPAALGSVSVCHLISIANFSLEFLFIQIPFRG